MTDKELIKQEIERLIAIEEETSHLDKLSFNSGRWKALTQVKVFIDSLPEEPASEGIEDELERFAYSLPHSATGFWPKDIDAKSVEARTKYGVHHGWSYEQVMNIARHFVEWQKQQMKEALQTEYEKGRFDMREEMVKDAVEGEVVYQIGSSVLAPTDIRYKVVSDKVYIPNVKLGDKVKIIIVKTEQQ